MSPRTLYDQVSQLFYLWDVAGVVASGWLGYTSAFLSVYQEKAVNLFDLVLVWNEHGIGLGERRETLLSVAQALKQLHTSGIHHPDLTLRNLLIQPDHTRV